MTLPWVFHGSSRVLPLVSHGSLTGLPRVSRGSLMSQRIRGSPMSFPHVYSCLQICRRWSPAFFMRPHCPWFFHGVSIRDLHGTPIGFLRRFHGSGPHGTGRRLPTHENKIHQPPMLGHTLLPLTTTMPECHSTCDTFHHVYYCTIITNSVFPDYTQTAPTRAGSQLLRARIRIVGGQLAAAKQRHHRRKQ